MLPEMLCKCSLWPEKGPEAVWSPCRELRDVSEAPSLVTQHSLSFLTD